MCTAWAFSPEVHVTQMSLMTDYFVFPCVYILLVIQPSGLGSTSLSSLRSRLNRLISLPSNSLPLWAKLIHKMCVGEQAASSASLWWTLQTFFILHAADECEKRCYSCCVKVMLKQKPNSADSLSPLASSISFSLLLRSITLNQTPSVICQSVGSVIPLGWYINNEAACLLPRLTVSQSVRGRRVCVRCSGEQLDLEKKKITGTRRGTDRRLNLALIILLTHHLSYKLSSSLSQDTVSVHRPGFYADRFFKFMSSTVFKKSSCEFTSSPRHSLK